LLKIVKQAQKGTTTIVYTTFQSQADEIAGYLYVNGVSASSYHAGKLDQVGTGAGTPRQRAQIRILASTSSLTENFPTRNAFNWH
jgi:superfamily II DNA helicase RecQ